LSKQSQDKKVNELYEGREELLKEGTKRLGPMKIRKIQMILLRDKKALAYYMAEIQRGRTADQITMEELKQAGVKQKTIDKLMEL